MKKPLERCVNGCDAPVQPPSWVLCKACLDNLGAKMHALRDELWPVKPEEPSDGE